MFNDDALAQIVSDDEEPEIWDQRNDENLGHDNSGRAKLNDAQERIAVNSTTRARGASPTQIIPRYDM